MRKIIKDWIPPVLSSFIYKSFSQNPDWQGNYSNWEEACKASEGYQSSEIFENVRKSALKVKNGEATFERDSLTFDKSEYSFPFLAAILMIAKANNNQLKIVDFGGSLGSAFFRYSKILQGISNVRWNIIEQDKFVICGKNEFETKRLRFYSTIHESLKDCDSDTILFSSVLQYLKDPYNLINEVLSNKYFRYILIDRTPFSRIDNERLMVQKGKIASLNYSYPCWIFNEHKFLAQFMNNYKVTFDFYSEDNPTKTIAFKGFFLEKNDSEL